MMIGKKGKATSARSKKKTKIADIQPQDGDRLAFMIPEFCVAARIGRSTVYEEIRSGRLKTVKVGSRTLIPVKEAEAWLKRLAKAA